MIGTILAESGHVKSLLGHRVSDDCPMSAIDDRAARLRAAFAFARLSKQRRADALGVGVRHVSRYESGETPVPSERLEAVVDATSVPRWFLEHGFTAQPQPEEPTVTERLEALERKVETLVRRESATDDPPAPPGELFQSPADGKTTGGTDRGAVTSREPDAGLGTGL